MTPPDESLPAPTPPNEGEVLLYRTPGGDMRVEVFYQAETFWLTQARMAEPFGASKQTISYHIRHIFESKELDRAATVKEILTVQDEGGGKVSRAAVKAIAPPEDKPSKPQHTKKEPGK
jgi:hypothetical protein